MINTLLKRRMENTKKNKKGFTLVELIVVLVIIAILAAVLVPTVSGYIGKAKKTAAQSTLKNVVTASQSAGTSLIAKSTTGAVSGITNYGTEFETEVTDVGGSDVLTGVYNIILDDATGTVLYADYTDGTYWATYTNGTYATGKSTPAWKTTAPSTPTGLFVYKVGAVSNS